MSALQEDGSCAGTAAHGGGDETPGMALLAACAVGDVVAVRALLEGGGVAAAHQDDASGESALMRAAGGGRVDVVRQLLEGGAPWNALDRRGRCAGDHAMAAQSQPCVDALVEAGVRAQLLFGLLEESGDVEGATTDDRSAVQYLASKAAFDDAGETLLDAGGDAVMMEWERPLMNAHADLLLGKFPHAASEPFRENDRLTVCNVGHGLGIVDGYIWAGGGDRLAKHTIVEPHPDVLARMDAWRAKSNVAVAASTWRAALDDPNFGPFDGIFFDTYAETYADMRDFFRALPRLLKRGGVFSYFNGVAPFNTFFHGVACQLIKTELESLGFETDFVPLKVEQLDETTWDGVKRRYWQFDSYHLPVVTWKPEAAASDP